MTAQDDGKQLRGSEAPPAHIRELDPVAEFMARAVSRGASSQEIAEVVGRVFQSIAQILVPIVGELGVTALYRRSLHLAGSTDGQMSIPTHAVPMATAIAQLELELAKLTAVGAAAASTELLRVFYGLLTSLIGQSLTERLLRPVWINFLDGSSALGNKP